MGGWNIVCTRKEVQKEISDTMYGGTNFACRVRRLSSKELAKNRKTSPGANTRRVALNEKNR